MREIEIKVSIDSPQRVIDMLQAKSITVSHPVRQHDRVFGVRGATGDDMNTLPWLRIRSETVARQTRHIFTLKKSVTSQLDSIEHETEIADDAELAAIITHLDFVPYSDLTKTRQTAHMDGVEVCIDTVDSLGSFMEVEKLTDETADIDTVRTELWAVLTQLGIDPSSEITDGYDVLMNRKLAAET